MLLILLQIKRFKIIYEFIIFKTLKIQVKNK